MLGHIANGCAEARYLSYSIPGTVCAERQNLTASKGLHSDQAQARQELGRSGTL